MQRLFLGNCPVMKFICVLPFFLLLTGCQLTSQSEPAIDYDDQVYSADQLNTEQGAFSDEFNNDPDSVEEEGLSHLVEDTTVAATEESLSEDLAAPVIVYDNLWLKLAEGFKFDIPDNARITKHRNYYLKHPKYLQQVSKRAEPFLYLIIEQIEENNLPLN